jgi:hypothetical protein
MGIRFVRLPSNYNPAVETEGLKILLALEPKWTVSLNGLEFLPLESSEISVENSTIQFGRYVRSISQVEWLRPNIVRVRGNAKFRSQIDTITLYPGDRLPSLADLRRKRRTFQAEIGPALCSFFAVRKIERQMLYSDRQHGVGGAYPRFLAGKHAVIAVDPDESSAVVNGLMRAALLWAPLIQRPVAAVVPYGRHQTISARLRRMPKARLAIQWLKWDGESVQPLGESADEPETHVQKFVMPDAAAEVERICSLAPGLLQAVPHIAGKAVSIRLRGVEVARVSDQGAAYPFGEPLADVINELAQARRHGSRHPLARAHEERWLESNLLADIRQLIPSIDTRHIYPQVPSFVGEDRNIIDLLTITAEGRLVVIEVKSSPDPDLPFQALDYWIAVERHRKAGDFQNNGYFAGCNLQDAPALLILVAPLLAYHKTAGRLIAMLPADVPLMEVGINQNWKKHIKVLRRKGMVS